VKLLIFLFPVALIPLKASHISAFFATLNNEKLLLIYILWSIVTLSFAAEYQYSSQKLFVFSVQYLSLLSLLSLARLYIRQELLLLFASSAAVVGLALIIPSIIYGIGTKQDMLGGIIHANNTAVLIGVACIVLIFNVDHRKFFSKTLSVAVVVLAFLLLRSKMAFFSILAGFGIARAFGHAKAGSAHYISLMAFGFLLLLLFALLAPELERLGSENLDLEKLYTLSSRTIIWQMALADINLKSLLVGHGFAVISPGVALELEWVEVGNAHNTFLHLLNSGGIVGFVVFLFYLLGLFRKNLRGVDSFRKSFVSFYILAFIFLMTALETIIGIRMTPGLAWLVVLNNLPIPKPPVGLNQEFDRTNTSTRATVSASPSQVHH
jgi:O-antigen ligase